MEEKDLDGFSWTAFFIVTGISFGRFSGLMKILDGSSTHIALFARIGIACGILGVLFFISQRVAGKPVEARVNRE